MKSKITPLLALSILVAHPLRADDMKMPMKSPEPAASWPTLEKQADDLAADVAARNVRPIHKLDHAVADETAALKKAEPPLPAGQKQKLEALLADLSAQVHRAHMDGHADKWDDAAAAQKQFARDVREAKAIAAPAQ